MRDTKTLPPPVQEKFDSYPDRVRAEMIALRQLILRTAEQTAEVGELEECLKWGEPSFLPRRRGVGSTVRMDWKPSRPEEYALYFNCQTSLISTFRTLYADRLAFGGNRSIILRCAEPLPEDELSHCIALALTYHLRKNHKG